MVRISVLSTVWERNSLTAACPGRGVGGGEGGGRGISTSWGSVGGDTTLRFGWVPTSERPYSVQRGRQLRVPLPRFGSHVDPDHVEYWRDELEKHANG